MSRADADQVALVQIAEMGTERRLQKLVTQVDERTLSKVFNDNHR